MKPERAAVLSLCSLAALAYSTPSPAASGEWLIDAKASYVVLGDRAAHATGGLMPSLSARRTWPVKNVFLGLGAGIGVFGLSGDAAWMGILGGPIASIAARPFGPALALESSIHLDFGRMPLCNRWGLCTRHVGAFPLAEVGVVYSPAAYTAVIAACGARLVRTLAWSGMSVEPAVSGRVFW